MLHSHNSKYAFITEATESHWTSCDHGKQHNSPLQKVRTLPVSFPSKVLATGVPLLFCYTLGQLWEDELHTSVSVGARTV